MTLDATSNFIIMCKQNNIYRHYVRHEIKLQRYCFPSLFLGEAEWRYYSETVGYSSSPF